MLALAGFLLSWVAVLQPLNGVVFVLDGILIGAGDLRFLAWAMAGAAAVFVPAAAAVAALDAGIGWLWAALGLLMVTRAGHAGRALHRRPLGGARRRALIGARPAIAR